MQYLLILIGCDGETTLYLFVPLRFTQHALTTYQSFRYRHIVTSSVGFLQTHPFNHSEHGNYMYRLS